MDERARDAPQVATTAGTIAEQAETESGGTPASVGAPGPRERKLLRRVRRTVYAVLAILAVLLAISLVRAPSDALVLLELACVIAVAAGIWTQLTLSRRFAERTAAHEAGITRMLQGMSRSVSSDAIVQTILDELRGAANADHVAVARLRPVDRVVEATLVSSRARVPASRTTLPASVLDPERLPAGHRLALADDDSEQTTERAVAHEIARRLADAYALPNTLAVPLVTEDRILGALILSRRLQKPWTAGDRRLLSWASAELSAALARALAFEEAENQANVDVLTGLPNRRYLEELLSSVAPRRRSGDRIGALMIDLDHFKKLNDRYGHATGDRVLRAVGEQISSAVRADDTPARYGGEEFAVVLRRATRDQAVEVAERIRAQIADIPPTEMGIDERITVSVGIAVGDARATNVSALLGIADSAMYRAKRQGRNRIVLAA